MPPAVGRVVVFGDSAGVDERSTITAPLASSLLPLDSTAGAGCGQGGLQEAGDGHRPGAARVRTDGASDGLDRSEVDVADNVVVDARHTRVDDGGPRPDPVGGDQMGTRHIAHDHVSLAAQLGEVGQRLPVGEAGSAKVTTAPWLTEDSSSAKGAPTRPEAAEDDDVASRRRDAVAFEQAHDTECGAADVTRRAEGETAEAGGSHAVDVLGRVQACQCRVYVEVAMEENRQEDSVHRGVRPQTLDGVVDLGM